VRLKFKLNEKYQQLVTKSPEGKSGMLVGLIEKEVGPLMDKVNELLELDPQERDLFLKYRAGYNGSPPTENKFFEYFQANQNTRKYVTPEEATAAAPAATTAVPAPGEAPPAPAGSRLGGGVFAPLIFFFFCFVKRRMRGVFFFPVPHPYFLL